MKILIAICLVPYAMNASGTIANHVPSGVIDVYRAERDEKSLLQIAHANMPALVSLIHRKEPKRTKEIEQLLNTDILGAFKHPDIHSRVYLHNAITPAGFINYTIKHPWYLRHPRGTIVHLAVDAKYRRFGYGGALLQHAIEHCKTKSAKNIELRTTGIDIAGTDLARFYNRFGFLAGHCDKFSNITIFTRRLK